MMAVVELDNWTTSPWSIASITNVCLLATYDVRRDTLVSIKGVEEGKRYFSLEFCAPPSDKDKERCSRKKVFPPGNFRSVLSDSTQSEHTLNAGIHTTSCE